MKKLLNYFGTTEIRNILAVLSVVGSFVLIYMLIIKPIPSANVATVNIALGFVFGGLVGGVGGYYFGASKTDKPKE